MRCNCCGEQMQKTLGDYKYTESGLSNVILGGVTIYKCACGEESVVIPNLEGLHRTIGMALARKPSTLTAEEIRFLRKEMGLRAIDLSDMLGVNKVTISRWESNAEVIGNANDKLLRVLYLQHLMSEEKKALKLDFVELMKDIKHTHHKKKKAPKNIKIDMPRLDSLAPAFFH